MKKIIALHILLFLTTVCYSQSNNAEEKFIRVVNDECYGLFNTEGKEILPPIYDIIFKYNEEDEGIELRLNREEYIFNKKTHKVQKIKITDLKYEAVGNFHEDLARIKIKGKYGYVDRSGKLIIPAIYSIAHNFSEGLAMVAYEDKKYGFIDKTGKTVIPFQYDSNYDYEFSNQFIRISKDKKVGLIDATGKEITEFKYDEISSSSRGLLEVKIKEKYGLIDTKGYEITPVKYDMIGYFGDSLAVVKEIDKYGFINKSGKLVIPLKYDDADGFLDGTAKVKLGKKFGIIDKTGEEIINVNYDEIQYFEGDLVPVKLNGKWGIINKKEEQVADFKFDKIIPPYKTFSTFKDEENITNLFFIVGIKESVSNSKSQYLWGIINPEGKEIVTPKYLGIGKLKEDLIRIEFGKGGFKTHIYGCDHTTLQIPGKWGFINVEGEEVISPTYDYVKDFSEGLAAFGMIKNNVMKWGFINKKNEEIIPIAYHRVQNFRNGFSMVKLNGKWGLIDKTGRIIIPVEYDEIDDFKFSPDPYHDDLEINVPTDRYDYEGY